MRSLIVALCLLVSSGTMAGNVVRSYHLDRSGLGSSDLCDTTAGCPTLGIWFDNAVAATYTAEVGGQVLTVNGNPTRVAAGTWPAGFSGSPGYSWRMDGTGDYLSLADASGAFSSQGAWSVSCAVIPRYGFASGDVLAAKWNTTEDKRSWRLYTGGTSVVLDISSDGKAGTITTLTKASALAVNRLSWITASCDGAGNCSVWVDGLSVATSAVMGDPYEGNAAFTIGADAEAAGDGPVEFYRCVYQDAALTSADHLRAWRRFRGMFDSSAMNAFTWNAATAPDLQVALPADAVEPFIVGMPSNSGMLGKAGGCSGMYGSGAVTNLCQRSSFETWAGGAPTGWTEAVTSTGDCAQGTRTVHGSSSARCTLADNDDAVTLTGACLTVVGATAYRLSGWARLESGTGLLDLVIIEDDSADCATPTTITSVVDDAVPTAAWAKYAGNITTQAGTIRAQVRVSVPAAAAQVLDVDGLLLMTGTYDRDSYCFADTDASCVATASIPGSPSAISANGAHTIEMTVCSPWAGPELTSSVLFMSDGNGGAANSVDIRINAVTDEPAIYHWDAAGDYRSCSPSTATNWSAATEYKIRSYWNGLGDPPVMRWPGVTWSTASSGTGLAKRTAAQTTTYFASSHSSPANAWVKDIKILRGVVR